MLDIRGLTVRYSGLPVLKDINLTLEKGESLSIIGESGAGKTTLGLSVMGLVEGSCEGEILFQGKNLLSLKEEEIRRLRGREMAMVFQGVEGALHPLYTALDQVAEAIAVHSRKDAGSIRKKALGLLLSAGLDETTACFYPHQLSGGLKQRALIAMALANSPEILILDEPTASLDAGTKAEILALLNKLAGDRITIMITHDIHSAAYFSDRVAVLYGGRLIEQGPTGEVFKSPLHPYTRGLIRSCPDLSTTKDLQGIPGRMMPGVTGCSFHPRCTQRIHLCSLDIPEPVVTGGRLVACHRGGIVPLLEIKKLSKIFGKVKAVREVDLTLYQGETLALVGESGSGKTTLARTVMGLLKEDGGEFCLEGANISKRDAFFYQRVQMIFQNPMESISHRMNVLQAVREPLDINRPGDEEANNHLVRKALDEVELPGDQYFLNKYPHHLSGGEAQRVAIARALVLEPRVLIADEPTSALDASIQAKIIKLMLSLQEKRGLAILLITHDIALARKVSDRMAVMLKGSIVEEGPAGKLLGSPRHQYTRLLVNQSESPAKSMIL